MGELKIIKRTDSQLVLDRSRLGSLLSAVFISGFTVAWYYLILEEFLVDHSLLDSIQLKIESDKVSLLFLFAGLLLLHQVYISLRNALYGEKFEFIKSRGQALRNGKLFFNLVDVVNIQIREISDSDGDITYRLSVITKNNGKKFIESTNSKSSIYPIASDLADILGVKIISKT